MALYCWQLAKMPYVQSVRLNTGATLAICMLSGRIDMFNGYNWQTRTLEVRPDRLPPDFDNPNPMLAVNPAGSLPSASSGHTLPLPIHSTVFPYGNSLGDGTSSRSSSEEAEVAKLIGERARTASAGSRSLFVGNVSNFNHKIRTKQERINDGLVIAPVSLPVAGP